MKHRNVTWSLMFVLALLAWAAWHSRLRNPGREAVWRHPAALRFTPEALCQLRCLQLTKSDAAALLQNGVILYHRSNRRSRPCPVWELQGTTASGHTRRMRLEQCSGYTVVVRVSPPSGSDACHCNAILQQKPTAELLKK